MTRRTVPCFQIARKTNVFLVVPESAADRRKCHKKPVAEIKARLHGASCLFLRDELPCSNLRGHVNWLGECGLAGLSVPVTARAYSYPGDFSLN